MRVNEFLQLLARELPLDLAMPDDPVGLQVMAEDRELINVAVAYELDERMVRLADQAGAGLIVAFHPLLYPSLARITTGTRVERTVIELIDRRIALYVVHTAFDAHPEGTSVLLARKLGLESIRPLVPDARHAAQHGTRHAGAGMGAIGTLAEPLALADLARRLQQTCNAQGVRVSLPADGTPVSAIRSVAILGGSGMSFYDHAVRAGADALITADIRYHGFHAANDSIPVLDPGHAESEVFVTDGLAALVERALEGMGSGIGVVALRESTNPIRLIV